MIGAVLEANNFGVEFISFIFGIRDSFCRGRCGGPLTVGACGSSGAISATVSNVVKTPAADTALDTFSLSGRVCPPYKTSRALFGFGPICTRLAGKVAEET